MLKQTEAQKETVRKWIEALRSGKYKQGRDKLRCNDNFCCLGVLCELMDIPSTNLHKEQFANLQIYSYNFDEYGVGEGLIPQELFQEWTGIDYIGKLVGLNDGSKYSFNEIADYLEKTYLEVQNAN